MQKNLMTIAILLSANVVWANEQTAKLAEIKVYSAYATPVNQDKTASSVTVLTEKDFAARNATYVSEVLKTVPSVAFSSFGGRGTLSNVSLRGADANHTVVVIDGVKVNPVSGYGFDFGGLSLSHIERIEVLRGEQSALWGSEAMGGVIYITTKSGLYKEKPFNFDFDLGTGSKGTIDSSATISGYQNGFYYALNGNSHRTRGISAYSADKFNYTAENGARLTSGGAIERDKFHQDGSSIRLGFDDSQKGFDFLASHRSQTSHFDGSYAQETAFDDYTRNRDTVFKLSGFMGNDGELLKQQVSVSHQKNDADTAGSLPSRSDAKKLNANYQLDLNVDRDGEVKQAVSLLGDYQRSTYHSSAFTTEKRLSERSLAAEYRLFSEADHSLTLSGRYLDSSRYQNAWTGRIAGAYRISENLKTHASFGTAVQNPTMTEVYGWSGAYIGNPDLKPEKSQGGDVGFLFETDDKRHSLDVTYFARNVRHLISSEVVDFATYVSRSINSDGISQIKGVEVAYNGKLSDKFSQFANYTYTRGKDGNSVSLIRRPKHTANLGLAYQITEQFGTNLTLSYIGKRIDSLYDENSYLSARVKMPSYALVHLGANYQLNQNVSVYANLNNALNKKYEHTAGYGQYGRNFYVGLKGTF